MRLVARLAIMEWPPRLGGAGEVAREPATDGTLDGAGILDGVWEPDREGACEDCGCIAGCSFVGAGGSSSSSSSCNKHEHSKNIYKDNKAYRTSIRITFIVAIVSSVLL
jgi:hypothetical protein